MVEEHQHAAKNKGGQHVGKEGGFPRPRRGGVKVLEHRSNLNQRHDLHLFSERPGEGSGQVIHQQVDLRNQDDGEGGVERLKWVRKERVRQAKTPQCVQSVEGQMQAKQHECRGDQGPFHPPTDFRIQGALGEVEEQVLQHARITCWESICFSHSCTKRLGELLHAWFSRNPMGDIDLWQHLKIL